MDQRGRKSVAKLSIVRPDGITSVARIPPPEEMPNDEAAIWVGIVESKPADWFDAGSIGLLADYCVHRAEIPRLSADIRQMRAGGEYDVSVYKSLLAMRETEIRSAKALATAMRLTQQSTYSARKNATISTTKKPWDE